MIFNSKRSSAELGMLVVSYIWGGTFVLIKDGLNFIGPVYFTAMLIAILSNTPENQIKQKEGRLNLI